MANSKMLCSIMFFEFLCFYDFRLCRYLPQSQHMHPDICDCGDQFEDFRLDFYASMIFGFAGICHNRSTCTLSTYAIVASYD